MNSLYVSNSQKKDEFPQTSRLTMPKMRIELEHLGSDNEEAETPVKVSSKPIGSST